MWRKASPPSLQKPHMQFQKTRLIGEAHVSKPSWQTLARARDTAAPLARTKAKNEKAGGPRTHRGLPLHTSSRAKAVQQLQVRFLRLSSKDQVNKGTDPLLVNMEAPFRAATEKTGPA